MHDETLLSKWQHKRDGEAFHALTLKYGAMIYATALRILRNPKDAEDITQTCFEKLATTRKVPGNALGPWLHRVAVNAALDWRKGNLRRSEREAAYEQERPESTIPTWDDIYPLVDEAIAALPESQRFAVVAHYLEHRTHAEIAAEAGVSREAITQRIHRGVDQVRATLKKRGIITPAVVLGTLLSSELRRAAALPPTLETRLGHIAVSGLVLQGGSGLMGSFFSAKAIIAALVVVTGLAGAFWTLGAKSPAPPQPVDTPSAQPSEAGTSAGTTAARIKIPSAEPVDLAAASPPAASVPVALSGRVYDAETDAGISEANVGVRFESRKQGETLVTDESGAYSLDALPAGSITVYVRSANGYLVPMEHGAEGGRVVRNARDGDPPLEIDFSLERGAGYRGRVVDGSGAPIEGATVTGGARVQNYNVTKTARSAPDGTFLVSGFPPTQHGWLWAETDALTSISMGPLSFSDSDRDGEDLLLVPKARIEGRVVYSTGEPVVDVQVSTQYNPDVRTRDWAVQSDKDGRFELTGLAPGMLSLVAWDGNDNLNEFHSLTLAPGDQVTDIELLCPKNDYHIAGRVVDARGNGLSRARVECIGLDVSHRSSIRANPFGEFTLDNIPAGSYHLKADHYGSHLETSLEAVKTGQHDVRIVLGDLPRVEGRVVDGATGKAIASFKVKSPYGARLLTHPQRYEDVEDEEGNFVVPLSHLDENIIAARAEGYLLGKTTVTASEAGEVIGGIELRLTPQEDFRGSVVDANQSPVRNAIIYSGEEIKSDSDDYVACRSGDDGSFLLPADLVAHDFITVVHPDYPNSRLTFTQEHYAGEPVIVSMAKGASITWEVFDNGKPTRQAYVYLSHGKDHLRPPANAEGQFVFNGLAPGEYFYQVTRLPQSGSDGASRNGRIEVAEGEQQHLRTDLYSGTAELSGDFVDEIPNFVLVKFSLDTETGPQTWSSHDARTSFQFTDMPAGHGLLEVHLQGAAGQGHVKQRYEIELIEGMALTQDILFTGQPRIEGRIGAVPERGIGRIFVYWGVIPVDELLSGRQGLNDDQCANVPFAEDSTFTITGLRPGTYTLLALLADPNGVEPLHHPGYGVVELGIEDVSVILAPVE